MNVFEVIQVESAGEFIQLMRRSHALWRGRSDTETEAFSRYFNGRLADEELEIFAIAQHHGIPTLLLDWSFDPLVAAYFAAEGNIDEPASHDLAVWALRRSLFETKAPWPLDYL